MFFLSLSGESVCLDGGLKIASSIKAVKKKYAMGNSLPNYQIPVSQGCEILDSIWLILV